MDEPSGDGGGLSRRTFIMTSAGVATAVGAPVAVALADKQHPVVTEPSAPTPREPVMAYIRDAKRGELTVVAGTTETTYRDPELVKRLMAIAPQEAANVVAP
ncbi:MAG TPA: hypothetical protein VIX82_19835 [Solirubrobacteraceae bacterium]